LGVRLFICPITGVPHSTAVGLLLCAWRAREIDRLLHGRCPEAAMLQLGAQQRKCGQCHCQQTELEGGLQRLLSADDVATKWLKIYGS